MFSGETEPTVRLEQHLPPPEGRGLGGGHIKLSSISLMLWNYGPTRPKTAFARQLRKKQTSGEKVLWKLLRRNRFEGLHIRRQSPIGPYIVDFLCMRRRMVIEIDGSSHFAPGAQEYDRRREDYLRQKGFWVIRFSNAEVVRSPELVLARLRWELGNSRPEPSP